MGKVDFKHLLSECDTFDERGIDFVINLLFSLKNIYVYAQPSFSAEGSNDLEIRPEEGIVLRGFSYNIHYFDKNKKLISNIYCKPGEGILGDVYKSKYACLKGALKFIYKNNEYYKIFKED